MLARTPGLIGKTLTLTVNPEDIRNIRAALPDGSDLGILTAHGVWGRTPHSLEVRRAIFRLRRRRELFWSQADDPIDVYLQYLSTKGQKRKRARNRWKKTHEAATRAAPDHAVEANASSEPAARIAERPTTAPPIVVQPTGLKALVY